MTEDLRQQQAALVALAGLPHVGPRRLAALLSERTPRMAFDAILAGTQRLEGVSADRMASWRVQLRDTDTASLLDRYGIFGVTISTAGDRGWPARFADDPEPPAVLFSKGSLATLAAPTVGVVGTRRCSRYGRDIAFELGRTLGAAGVAVVSGLALGIDAAAHAGVLQGGGLPIGVVAGGLDVIYPSANRGLWDACATAGLLLSEMPLGARTGRWGFPARNRIIAALSDLVVVVESGETGGSLYTVDEALRRDRPVFAVPGPIRSAVSAGTNRLLADGAAPMCSPDDVLVALGLERPQPHPKPVSPKPATPKPATRVADRSLLDEMGWEPITVDDLVERSGRDAADVALQIERLLAEGRVVRSGGCLERTGEQPS